MGAVYKARQMSLDRVVSLLVLTRELSEDTKFVRNFESEARKAARLKHPHLVQVYDVGRSEGLYWISMEYLEVESVEVRVVRDGPLVEHFAVGVCLQVVQALQHAWEKSRLIHGDIKPRHILLERETHNARLAELGFGKSGFVGEGDPEVSDTVFTMGTPQFVSPEKAMRSKSLDFRADMYSLGATMYFMLTGKVPFDGLDPAAMLASHLRGHLPDPRTYRPGLHQSMVSVLERLLAKDPVDRYPTWAALAHDLTQIQENRGLSAPPLAPGKSTLQRSHGRSSAAATPRRKTGVGTVAEVALFIALVGVVGWYFFLYNRQTKEEVAPQSVAPTNATATAAPIEEPPPTEEPKEDPAVVAEREKAAREEEDRLKREQEEARKAEEQKAAQDLARTRYTEWKSSLEEMLAAHEYERALDAVSQAKQDPQFTLVHDKLEGDDALARALIHARDTGWANAVGQTAAVGASSGTITKVEGDKFWVKLAVGEVAVPRSTVEPAKLAAWAVSPSPQDADLNLAAGMFLWYHGEKRLARAYLSNAMRLGASPSFELPIEVTEAATATTSAASPTTSTVPPSETGTGSTPAGIPSIRQPAQIDIVVKKGLKRGYSGTDYDNKRDVMSFTVQIKSKEFRTDYKTLKATLYVYGRNTSTQLFQLLLKESSELDLPRGGSHEFDGGTLSLEYDDNYSAQFGVKYAGYVLVIRDEQGAVVKAKSTNQSFVNNVDKLDEIGVGSSFDGTLNAPSRGGSPR